jgi:SET domain-containing protein
MRAVFPQGDFGRTPGNSSARDFGIRVHASKSKYLFAISQTKTIDGWEKTNIARYINHSCRPNCEIEISRGRIYVMAKRRILPGEELSYDYETEYFDAHIKPKGCRCSKCSPDGR